MILGVIPARFASTRFPGKPLVDILGKSMLQRVYEQASQCRFLKKVVVATDDTRIEAHVREFGGNVVLTRIDHPSGTDRCAEAAARENGFSHVVNIQGDEPFIQPRQIDLLCETLLHGECVLATLVKKISDREQLYNPNVVKAVVTFQGRALYFSRLPLPFYRDIPQANWLETGIFYKHIGLYGYTREALLQISKLPPSPLEKAESLEQLRWLENGFSIAAGITPYETLGIDTPEDVKKALDWLDATNA